MIPAPTVTVDVRLSSADWQTKLASDCIAGLTSTPKWLSPVWFYDARGSDLFDAITRVPEYYPTRAERALLRARGDEIAGTAQATTLVELGSGSSDKTRCLLDAMSRTCGLDRYVPVDVSETALRDAASTLVSEYPQLVVEAVVGDFSRHLDAIPRDGGGRLVAFLGGTIGNLDPAQRRRFLFDLDCAMDRKDHLLLGVDLVKDPEVLVRAYDDAGGVTAAFNRNALCHLNTRYGADFDSDSFAHVARWNPTESWIEMHLRSDRDQTVHLPGLDLTVPFRRGELLRTEISAKFTPEQLTTELWQSGFVIDASWIAPPGYLLALAHPYC